MRNPQSLQQQQKRMDLKNREARKLRYKEVWYLKLGECSHREKVRADIAAGP
jgi:hypothetical protein